MTQNPLSVPCLRQFTHFCFFAQTKSLIHFNEVLESLCWSVFAQEQLFTVTALVALSDHSIQ